MNLKRHKRKKIVWVKEPETKKHDEPKYVHPHLRHQDEILLIKNFKNGKPVR